MYDLSGNIIQYICHWMIFREIQLRHSATPMTTGGTPYSSLDLLFEGESHVNNVLTAHQPAEGGDISTRSCIFAHRFPGADCQAGGLSDRRIIPASKASKIPTDRFFKETSNFE
jgi:hypothetical protein